MQLRLVFGWTALVLFSSSLLGFSEASAADRKTEALKLADSGRDFAKRKKFGLCATMFKEAYALDASEKTYLYSRGRCEDLGGHPAAAARLYRQFLREARKNHPLRPTATALADAAEAKVPPDGGEASKPAAAGTTPPSKPTPTPRPVAKPVEPASSASPLPSERVQKRATTKWAAPKDEEAPLAPKNTRLRVGLWIAGGGLAVAGVGTFLSVIADTGEAWGTASTVHYVGVGVASVGAVVALWGLIRPSRVSAVSSPTALVSVSPSRDGQWMMNVNGWF